MKFITLLCSHLQSYLHPVPSRPPPPSPPAPSEPHSTLYWYRYDLAGVSLSNLQSNRIKQGCVWVSICVETDRKKFTMGAWVMQSLRLRSPTYSLQAGGHDSELSGSSSNPKTWELGVWNAASTSLSLSLKAHEPGTPMSNRRGRSCVFLFYPEPSGQYQCKPSGSHRPWHNTSSSF